MGIVGEIDSFLGKVFCGSCVEVMKTMPDNSVDLCVTSPPYNLDIAYQDYKDDLPWDVYYEWCREWLQQIFRILKEDGRLCINHYLSVSSSFGKKENRQAPLMTLNQIAIEIGFRHHSLALWEEGSISKNTAWGSWLSASSPYVSSPYEGILILYKNRWKKDSVGVSDISKEDFVMAVSGIWKLGVEKDRFFPAPFPERLPQICIQLLSYKNDVVFDPFSGSGTTCVASKRLGRRYVGIDISPAYCKMAEEKLARVTLQMPLFDVASDK